MGFSITLIGVYIIRQKLYTQISLRQALFGFSSEAFWNSLRGSTLESEALANGASLRPHFSDSPLDLIFAPRHFLTWCTFS